MLAAYGNALVVRALSLAMDCLCCSKCEVKPCTGSDECGGKDCQCIKGQCSGEQCTGNDDCPLGYICVNGECVPACSGENCHSSAECTLGCDCVDGSCLPKSDLFYCVWASEPVDGHGTPLTPDQIAVCERDPNCTALPEKICRRGPPTGSQVLRMGPFAQYQACCASSCGCNYECNPVGETCLPDPLGEHENQDLCQSLCGSPSDIGRCCKSVVTRDADGKPIYVERGPNDICPTTRTGCKSGGDTYRSFNANFSNCDLCPTTQIGACCLPDGTCRVAERVECENVLGGIFKGVSWIDCETPRDPDVGQFFDFACEGCNGKKDCACDADERCVSLKCEPCGDHVFLVPPGQKVFTGIAVNAGDLVDVYVRSCQDGLVVDDLDREVRLSLNDPDETFLGLVQVEHTDIPVTKAGDLVLSESRVNISVCVTVTPGVGAWWVDCFSNGTVPGVDDMTCAPHGAGPFNSSDEANAWVIANPPPPGCEHTIVEVPARRNPLP